jgi:acyl-CoA synthetase (AMP-forming)/AMP-acid ligase II
MGPGKSHSIKTCSQDTGCRTSGWQHIDSIFITDGKQTIRYRDLSNILQNADRLMSNYLAGIDQYRETGSLPLCWIGIDTTKRIEASLWMIYCWMRHIPFIPFAQSWLEPVSLFRPDIIITASTGREAIMKEGGLRTPDARFSATKIFTAPALSRNAAGGPDQTAGIPHEKAGDPGGTAGIPPSMLTGNPDHPFCGLATSGSSGRPKRVALLRRNMIAAAKNAFMSKDRNQAGSNTPVEPDGYEYLWGNCLPLCHTGGLAILFRALLSGTGIYLWDRFDPEVLTHDLQVKPGIRRLSLVPTMLTRLMQYHSNAGITVPRGLEMVLLGGGPANQELIDHARNTSWPVCFSYGMTETCGQIAAQAPGRTDPAGSVGKLFPGHEAMIHDGQGREVAHGKTGLLRIRGPQVFPGYLDSSRQIVASDFGPDPDGWFETGDFARIDQSGRLFIEARRTDLIISGGQNVNPVEVEDILRKNPLVRDAAVTGVPDEEWGQVVTALIVPEDDRETARETVISSINTQARQYLKPHKRPKRILFVSSIPRTSLGKVERSRLRELATDLPA